MISPRDHLPSCQPLPKSSPAAVHYGRTLIAAVGGEVQVGIIHAIYIMKLPRHPKQTPASNPPKSTV
jgi:hypothetical protein